MPREAIAMRQDWVRKKSLLQVKVKGDIYITISPPSLSYQPTYHIP